MVGSMDARGNPVSNVSPQALDAINDFTARLIRIDQGAEAILEAAERWPDTPMIRLCASAFILCGQTDDALRAADTHLDALARQIAGANERERAIYAALRLWWANDNVRAVEALEAVTEKWPTDLFAAKLAEFLYYVLGQQHMGARFRAHMGRIGGSDAQDDLFRQTFLRSLQAAGWRSDATSYFDRISGEKIRTPLDHALAC
jgi:hypothetical protein